MNNVLGIIAEYNPFHNGHKYLLDLAKKESKSNYCVAIISGNFTQRGDCSIVNKWEKTKMALYSGVDLVIELPTLYSISSAETFASAATTLMNSIGIVSHISFGVENQELEKFKKIADFLVKEPIEYKKIFNETLDKGLSYPQARQNSVKECLGEDYSNLLISPNNILAIEYLKQLSKLHSSITPILIKRESCDHNSLELNNTFASSTLIRNLISQKNFNTLRNVIPGKSFEILQDCYKHGEIVDNISVFSNIIIYKLRMMSISDISNIPYVSEGLEFLIKRAAESTNDLEELISIIKSKRYTRTRINRILLCVLLGIKKQDYSTCTENQIRILGFTQNGKKLISDIHKKNPSLKIILSVRKFLDNNPNNRLLDIDITATNIYTLGYKQKSMSNYDFTQKVIEI